MIKATDYIGSLILENDTLQFIQTAEGRVVPKTVDGVDKNEYQYHLKDHLGNVRTTFAVRDDDYQTSFETVENPYFDNYDQITRLSNLMKKSGSYSHRLTGGGTDVVGLMKSLYVSKGDKISAEVYGKYMDAQFTDEGINGAALINALVSMLGGGTLSGEGTVVENSLNTDFLSAAMADDGQESSPKAYLNYILLDKNFNYLNSGFDRLGESAADPGDGTGTHQRLSFEEILIEEDGYLMVFLSNESDQSVEVFWDDFRVDHHYNAVLQADDYYPFGLTFNSYQRSYSKANNYKYNGVELNPTTQIYETLFRGYDPALGRFHHVDPLADVPKQIGFSPYHFSANNPINYVDPDGRCFQKVGDEYVPCDEADVGSTTTGAFGYDWTMTKSDGWQLTNGADPSTVNYEYDYIEASGSEDYYTDRYKNHIEKYNTRPPDYYLGYGHKYRVRFKALESELTKLGQEWSEQTGIALQEMMNDFISSNPNIQRKNTDFQKAAYETHIPAYTKNGTIGQLKVPDLWKIMWTPDLKDSWGNPDGRKQIWGMFPHVLQGPHYPEGYWDPQKNPGILKPWEPKF